MILDENKMLLNIGNRKDLNAIVAVGKHALLNHNGCVRMFSDSKNNITIYINNASVNIKKLLPELDAIYGKAIQCINYPPNTTFYLSGDNDDN